MNKKVILLRSIIENENITQRGLVTKTRFALGTVNKLIKESIKEGLIIVSAGKYSLSEEGLIYLHPYRVQKALIMAAGYGSRFVPLTFDAPKGLLKVYGEAMIERQIKQLKEVGIDDITIVVGYMKEKFEYLIDKFGCKLIYNHEYETKNNLSTIHAAFDEINNFNTYILSSDNFIKNNIFHAYEGNAWYSARHYKEETREWQLVTNKKGRILKIFPGGKDCDCMLGPAYFSREFGQNFLPVLEKYYKMPGTDNYFWENVLMDCVNKTASKKINAYYGHVPEVNMSTQIEMFINLQPEDNVYEFESLEELRKLDPKYLEDSGSKAMRLVSRVFKVNESDIVNIRKLKGGMTNNSWVFSVKNRSYICRVPGKGTDKLINRNNEAQILKLLKPLKISENVIFFDPENGYKISEYYEDSRTANPHNEVDMSYCMKKLASFHKIGITSKNHFDIRERISFYEKLCGDFDGIPFADYPIIRGKKDELLKWLMKKERPVAFCHIDSVADNFLFLKGADISKNERDLSKIKMIDWEYAGMCDPLIDVAMCAIYSYMDESGAYRLLCSYLDRKPENEEVDIVYVYMALGGLLWALWGVYKEQQGVNFTEYTIRMYRYFKKYSAFILQRGYSSAGLF